MIGKTKVKGHARSGGKSVMTYSQYLRDRLPQYDKMPEWEKAHVRKANRIDYNMYLMREEGWLK
jgi:hypothetical protein